MEVHVSFRGRKPVPQHVDIGMERENKVTVLCFEGLPKMDGSTAYLHIDLGDNSDVIEIVEGKADVTRTLTQFTGSVEAFAEVLGANDRVWHSQIMELFVGRLPILGEKIKQEYPTAFEQALTQTAADKAAAAKSAADAAATAAGIVTEEAARQDAEGKRVKAETARGKAEATRAENERLRASAESERVKAENTRVTAEENREKAEAAREQEMADALSSVAGVENTVQANEQQRVLAERTRAAQEQARQSAEQSRVEAEQARAQVEQRRDTAETARAEAERQRESMETSRQTAETTRNAAENGRAKAENARETAESQRQQAETARADAEGKRVQAEQGRVTAEQGRVEAEAQREEAMAQHAEKIAELEAEVAKKAQINDTTVSDTDAWSSQHIVDMLCPPLEESGNPVVCYPVAGSKLGVKASWEPTQEGSGEPYPAGGGKNLFNPAWMPAKSINRGLTWKMSADGTMTVNGTVENNGTNYYNSETFNLPAGTYTISAMTQIRMSIVDTETGDVLIAQLVGADRTFTIDSDVTAKLFFAASGTLNNVKVKPQIEKGSTATAYAPYANIRPIHGKSSVKVERCGENLWNIGDVSFNTYKEVSISIPPGGYTLSYNIDTEAESATSQIGILVDGNWMYRQINNKTRAAINITATRGITGMRFYAGSDPSYTKAATYKDMSLKVGTSAPAEYAPYVGFTTTLTLPSTVYGGEVGADGEGQETWGYIESYAGETLPSRWICDRAVYADGVTPPTGAQVAYKLAIPVLFTATGGGAIKALSGTNTVLTDADALTVTGRADSIHIIQQLQAASASATQAIANVERAVTDI